MMMIGVAYLCLRETRNSTNVTFSNTIRPHEVLRSKRKDNKYIATKSVECVHQVQDRVQWLALVGAVMHHRVL
jgi:hypothetical protein